MRRVSIVGNSGSGKSTFGAALAARLEVPFVELDAIHHQPGWRPLPREQFRDRVETVVAQDNWVIDGNYSAVQDLVWARADTVIWFDLPRRVVMRQIVWRSVRRTLARTELWNGNREPWRGLLPIDKEKSVIRWAWDQHAEYRDRYHAAAAQPGHLRFVRLGSRREAATLLATASPAS